MWERTKRILFRISSVLSKVEPESDLHTGSSSDRLRLRNTACGGPIPCTVYIRLDEHWDLVETIGELSGAIDEKPYSLCPQPHSCLRLCCVHICLKLIFALQVDVQRRIVYVIWTNVVQWSALRRDIGIFFFWGGGERDMSGHWPALLKMVWPDLSGSSPNIANILKGCKTAWTAKNINLKIVITLIILYTTLFYSATVLFHLDGLASNESKSWFG